MRVVWQARAVGFKKYFIVTTKNANNIHKLVNICKSILISRTSKWNRIIWKDLQNFFFPWMVVKESFQSPFYFPKLACIQHKTNKKIQKIIVNKWISKQVFCRVLLQKTSRVVKDLSYWYDSNYVREVRRNSVLKKKKMGLMSTLICIVEDYSGCQRRATRQKIAPTLGK